MTEQLRRSIEEQSQAIADQHAQIEDLARSERSLRESTRSQRLVFAAIIVAIVVVVALVVWFVLLKG